MGIPGLWCAKDVAGRLGVHPRTALKLMRAGAIESFKVSGRIWRTKPEHVEAYIARELERDRAARVITIRPQLRRVEAPADEREEELAS